jgi:hypothetical protein
MNEETIYRAIHELTIYRIFTLLTNKQAYPY